MNIMKFLDLKREKYGVKIIIEKTYIARLNFETQLLAIKTRTHIINY